MTCGEDFLVNFYAGPPFKFKLSHRFHIAAFLLNLVSCSLSSIYLNMKFIETCIQWLISILRMNLSSLSMLKKKKKKKFLNIYLRMFYSISKFKSSGLFV